MKYLAVLVIVFVGLVASDEEWKPISDKEELRKIHEDCLKEHEVENERNHPIYSKEHPLEREARANSLCPVLKMGLFTEDNGFNLDRLMAQIEVVIEGAGKLRDDVAGCLDNNEQKTSAADWAFRTQQCIMRTKIGEMYRQNTKTE